MSSRPPTGSATSAPKAATPAAASSPRERRSRLRRTRRATPASPCGRRWASSRASRGTARPLDVLLNGKQAVSVPGEALLVILRQALAVADGNERRVGQALEQ